MFKLLTNYIREQKTSLVQVFGLGFVIIIMVSSFLSLNFGTSYVSDSYWEDIAKEEFHQDVYFNPDARFKNGFIKETWLNNLDYMLRGNEIDSEKMLKATFQLEKLPGDAANNLYLYRFHFNSTNSDDHISVGSKVAEDTGHDYVDFKLSAPFNYPSVAEHNQFLKDEATILDSYVYDGSDNKNKINFFITNNKALEYHNSNKPAWDTHGDYTAQDIINQAKLYQYLLTGMLYGDNLSWSKVYYINDLLITGKTMSFIQTTAKDKVLAPILTDGNTRQFDPRNLADDEILVYRQFAEENNLKIGQDYIFAGYKFHIAGFATSILAANNATYFYYQSDNKNQTVAFTNQATMNKVMNNPYTVIYENQFFGFNPEVSAKSIGVTDENPTGNEWLYNYLHQRILDDKTVNRTKLYSANQNAIHNRILLNPLNIRTTYKVEAIEAVVWTNVNDLRGIFLEIASAFLGLIFVVVSVIVFIVIFKMIDRNKRLIGILKAHGYPSWKLNLALVASTIFPILLFAILGSAIAILFGHLIISTYSTAIILVSYGWPFYWSIALIVIFVPFVVLSIISFIMVAFLLKVKPLTLINNSWSKPKNNFSINAFFGSLISGVTKNFNYYNKLAITTTFRGFGKLLFVIIVSVFASTLLLFSFSSGGLVNNLLGLQFASINYKFNTTYNFDSDISSNFINGNNELLYKKETVSEIKASPSLYLPIRKALEQIRDDHSNTPKLIDTRYGYLMGSEMYKIRSEVVDPNLTEFPQEFQDFWNQNIFFIDYLTNDNGKNKTDLMINFGLLPYNTEVETPYTELEFSDAHDFNINTIDSSEYYYDNDSNVLQGDWTKLRGNKRTVYGVGDSAATYLSPSFKNTNFSNFTNLTLSGMDTAGGWLNTNFLNVRNSIIEKFNIQNPDTAAIKIIPMIGSTVPGIKNKAGGDGDSIGKTVLYRYQGLDSQTKYIIGVIYDGARNLLQNTILMPETWLNPAIFGNYTNLAASFANTKFTKFNESELHQYLPIISTKNDYLFDLTKIADNSYLKDKGIAPALTMIYDVDAIKEMFQARQYTLQTLIVLFAVFSVILSFMIIIIISNINIRDNLVLIDILRSLGYSATEISYVFLLTTIPILIIFSLFAIFIAPVLVGVVAGAISNFLSLNVPIIFKWWYFALTLLVVLLIYFISYLITWSVNVNNKKLMSQTK
ncbi:ABC transporter permease [Spiroplasma platyhelix]|uniref:ABC transporter permease n=1 Tax=Spiroplasma platyhelix PALS-1 TaxID=1276218 RepID=A0A846UC87_9MOLU|nr:ABC transporter permease [Spiroplasma platyhelix]MBE4703775.1 hypothetical protein [Spiroplasma platyhelix PALS-1]NKE38148.1 ABC transporter permease [Spiroplasma platyhelix PALS-1]UJB29033.1 hypothetical protein SPLAT_v1c02690 [Spiroplasma platyhelix PALS-1]